MKYLPDARPFPVLELSRRNLLALLAKLDDPASARTLLSPSVPGEPVIAVRAVEDGAHYTDRPSGEVYMPTSKETWVRQKVSAPVPAHEEAASDEASRA